MQQEIKGNIHLGGTVNPSKSTRVVKSVDQTSNFNNADEKRSKLKALIERGKFDKNVAITSASYLYICNKSVRCRNSIECSLCLTMVHLKCNNLNVADSEIIKNTGSDRFWICLFCSNNLFPFPTLNDQKLYQTLRQNNNHYNGSSNSYSTNTCSILKTPKNLSNLFNEFNNFSSQQNKNSEYH